MPRRSDQTSNVVCSVETDNGPLDYLWKRSARRRTLAIAVDARAAVSVFSPWHVPEPQVRAFLEEKLEWVLKKLQARQSRLAFLSGRRFEDGREFLFLGQRYVLRVREGDGKRGRVNFDGQGWSAVLPAGVAAEGRARELRRKMVQWYRAQAEEILGARVFHYARVLGKEPKRIAVRTQKRVWGNCDFRAQTIRLNWQIILAPIEVIDYVVVHELCHLFFPNHSKRFWKKVEEVLPDFKQRKAWLKDNAQEMVVL